MSVVFRHVSSMPASRRAAYPVLCSWPFLCRLTCLRTLMRINWLDSRPGHIGGIYMGPLSGLKVIELQGIGPGPYCGMMLADMGAEVIKVEKPGIGDDTRGYGPPFINGESAAFLTLNRNKKSIVLNLKDDRGLDLARKLISESDVVVQNFRPGTMEKLGLGYEEVKTFNPSLIYCSISGFGNSGPSSQKAGFDIVAQGMSGIMSFTGFPDLPPAKVGVPIADLNTGLFSAFAIALDCPSSYC